MASIVRKKRDGGKRCVAGGPNDESCGNSQHMPGGSIHHFPHHEKEPSRYMQWVRFVCRHKPRWAPGNKQAILCGIHFEESVFEQHLNEIPKHLTHQFKDRQTREKAISGHIKRKKTTTYFFASGTVIVI